MAERRASIMAGAVAGLGAGLVFATLHAIIIVPVWTRMIGGLVFGVLAGAAAGWAYGELKNDAAAPRSKFRAGATFGVLLWLAVVPVTLVNAYLRSTGFVQANRDLADALSVVLALIGGGVLGWVLSRRWLGALAAAASVVMLTMAMGGPVPVGRSVRAVEILFGILVAAIAGGVVLAYLEPRFRRRP